MEGRGWESCDFIFVSGDAYVDHPSFAAALVSRVLEDAGFRVGVIPQPDWKNSASYTVLGRPRLGFLVGAGNMDSMVAHYTAAKKPRSNDAYSPGGKAGFRPDRALLKYVEGIRRAYRDIPVIIGGIEAGLRRFAHYDYWSDTVRRSVLLDSKADILVYGMGERAIVEIARRLERGGTVREIQDVRGTCIHFHGKPYSLKDTAETTLGHTGGPAFADRFVLLPDYEAVRRADPASFRALAEHFMLQKRNADPASAKPLAERNDGERWVVQNPPAYPLGTTELDHIYELPFTRESHPMYNAAGGIPALREVVFSLVSSRGCFGGCSFCAITFHQGRALTARSRESLVREAETLTRLPGFKGYIHDIGGPTANFYTPPCARQEKGSFCPDRECLYPQPCPTLRADHGPYLESLKALRQVKHVKKVFIRSGIRYDYPELDGEHGGEFIENLCRYHVSGQLKVAPEHITENVLAAMGKGDGTVYRRFVRVYAETNRRIGLKQYLIPYYMSGHPGCRLEDAVDMALFLKKSRFIPDQVQDFYPTPGSLSTIMYRTGLDPRSMESIPVCRGGREKSIQRALLQFNRREGYALVCEGLRSIGREDLIKKLGAGSLLR
jgi:uncharacterized radical SAM protein YgiQ